MAISLVTPRERRRLRTIQTVAKGKIEKQTPPSVNSIIQAQKQKIFYKLANALDEIQEKESVDNYEHYFNLSQNILEDVPPSQAIAALLQISFGSSLIEKNTDRFRHRDSPTTVIVVPIAATAATTVVDVAVAADVITTTVADLIVVTVAAEVADAIPASSGYGGNSGGGSYSKGSRD